MSEPVGFARTLGPYRLVKPLGRGGMAEVWEADAPTGRVALKTLPSHLLQEDAAAARRFWEEAKLSLSLTHPNVVRTFDVGEDGGKVYLVMELLEGLTLADVLRLDERPPVGWVLAVALQLLDALAYVHAAPSPEGAARTLVHRDLKPSNLFVTREGDAKVIDFGIALGDAERTQTRTGLVRGSLPYCSPEQVRGEQPGVRSDLFSFGLVLHELFTGKRIFDQSSDAAIVGAILFNPILPLRLTREDVPPAVDQVVARLVDKDAALRPASASEAAELLRAANPESQVWSREQVAGWLARTSPAAGARDGAPTGTAPVRLAKISATNLPATELTPSRPRPVARRKRWPLAVVAVATGLVLVSAVGWEMSRARRTEKREEPPRTQVAIAPVATPPPAAEEKVEPKPAPVETASVEPTIAKPKRPPRSTASKPKPTAKAKKSHPPAIVNAGPPGFLTVATHDGWREIYVDGVDRGPTPLFRIELSAGVHQVEATREGKVALKKRVEIKSGEEARLGLE